MTTDGENQFPGEAHDIRSTHGKDFIRIILRKVRRNPFANKRSIVDETHPVATRRLVHIGCRDNDGRPALLDLRQNFPELPPRDGVHPCCRLVEEQRLRGVDKRAGESQLLLHSAGKIARPPFHERSEPREREQFIDAPPAFRAAHAKQIGKKGQVLLNTQVGIEAETLGHIPDDAFHLAGLFQRVESADGDCPRTLEKQAGGDAHERRFPRAVRADEAVHAPLFSREREPPQSFDISVALAKTGNLDCNGHGRVFSLGVSIVNMHLPLNRMGKWPVFNGWLFFFFRTVIRMIIGLS